MRLDILFFFLTAYQFRTVDSRLTDSCLFVCLFVFLLLRVPTTQLAKMSIDLKFVELTADVLEN